MFYKKNKRIVKYYYEEKFLELSVFLHTNILLDKYYFVLSEHFGYLTG